MILPLRRRQPQQHNNNIKTINSKDNDDNNNNNNNSIVLPRQRQEVGVCNMRTLCKYATIAILSIGFIYTFVAIGIYLGEAISDYISEWSVVPQFVIPENHLAASKFAMKPTIDNNRDLHDSDGLVIDVLSIGSHIRPEYLTAQIETWASHANVRNFWGLTEQDDYDPNCSSTNKNNVDSLIELCKSPLGWEPSIEQFRTNLYGAASGESRQSKAGWFCAQRRIGPALGFLGLLYQDNTTNIPDILVLVDDDTSVDIEKVKHQMLQNSSGDPFVGAACLFDRGYPFQFSFGGFGTFFNKASLLRLLQPIYCDEGRDDANVQSICLILHQNRIGELAVFRDGDSIFDLFYKFIAFTKFCMHSDWVIGYMFTFYGGGMHQLVPKQCRRDTCHEKSITCHNQSPNDMKEFFIVHRQTINIQDH